MITDDNKAVSGGKRVWPRHCRQLLDSYLFVMVRLFPDGFGVVL